jgi:hypothetical protein
MRYTPLIWPLLFGAALNAGLAIYALRRRDVPAARIYDVSITAVAIAQPRLTAVWLPALETTQA